MATDVDQLLVKLEALLTALRQFDHSLLEEFGGLDIAWVRLKQNWEGTAGEAFGGDWEKTRSSIKRYLDASKKHQEYLSRRIEALRRFKSGGGSLS